MKQLDQCKNVAGYIESARRYATQTPGLEPRKAQITMDYAQELEAVQRRCQTVTPQIEALRTPLLLKAMQSGEFGAAAQFVESASREQLLEAGRPELVLHALRTDAMQGDAPAMKILAKRKLPYEVPAPLQRPSELAALQIEERWLRGPEVSALNAAAMKELAKWINPALLGDWTFFSDAQDQTTRRLAQLQSPEGGLNAQERALAAEMLAAHERQQARP
ncbi:hypothetical protein G8A07_25575 [Roseateles sp. DAIF2]|uniref:hypothetical protein n=1 Tax=Roseateles sp. DAIF2 TaxID=2714952 RepID=UPI0018A28A6D|nr:hypothetical protein [Roseateles sp. DAIF2]QPF75956.1 hypothetical protein G8A07_25575 [Roseateles sp. DAIF2]